MGAFLQAGYIQDKSKTSHVLKRRNLEDIFINTPHDTDTI